LELQYDGPLSNFAFKFNLRRYILWPPSAARYVCPTKAVVPQGLVFDISRPNAASCTSDRTAKVRRCRLTLSNPC